MKHTSGPWKATKWGDGHWSVDAGVDTIARFNDMSEETEGNVHVVAAAPELLVSLEELLNAVTDNRTHGPEIYKAAEVIAKARGE